MVNIACFGSPFQGMTSSCSTKSPSKFRWKFNVDNNDEPVVICDFSISDLLLPFKNKFGWIVESPAINRNIINYIKSNRKYLSYSYKYIFTCVSELVGLEKNFVYVPSGSNIPWIEPKEEFKKEKLCSMFASPKKWLEGHVLRHQLAESYKNSLDLYGGMFGSQRLGDGIHPDKSDGLFPYMFSIVIENTNCDKYYTEKITDCFMSKTIPIYWGTKKIIEDFNQDGIIFWNENFHPKNLNSDLYFSKIAAIEDNYNRVLKLKMADDYIGEYII